MRTSQRVYLKQINRLKIYYNKGNFIYEVHAPGKFRVLEEFAALKAAEVWANTIHDFISRKDKHSNVK
jgi:hypothetical protein